MKLKIVSDGTPNGSRIVDQETGEELQNVKSIFWGIRADGKYTFASIELSPVQVEIETEFDVKQP